MIVDDRLAYINPQKLRVPGLRSLEDFLGENIRGLIDVGTY
jgi:hypothetical protein